MKAEIVNLDIPDRFIDAVLAKFQHSGGRQKKRRDPHILMAKTAYRDGMRAFAEREPEFGGLLVGPKGHRGVTHFIPDVSGTATPGSFTWDHAALNAVLRQYVALGLDARGFWHSHPSGCRRLSQGDLAFIRKVIAGNDVQEVLMPLHVDGECLPFIVSPDLRVAEAQLVLF